MAKEYKYGKKKGTHNFKFDKEFIQKTLDGVERWLLKNENNFSIGDLAALSSDTRAGSEEDSPLEQLLNCALQIYHWGRTHGDSDLISWRDHPSDVRKTFNSAILELGSNNCGKPNYKSQNELIVRMRYNLSRSYLDLDSQQKEITQDICVPKPKKGPPSVASRSEIIPRSNTPGDSPCSTSVGSRNSLSSLVLALTRDEAMGNPYKIPATGGATAQPNGLSSRTTSQPPKTSEGKPCGFRGPIASDLDPQSTPNEGVLNGGGGGVGHAGDLYLPTYEPQNFRESNPLGGREYRRPICSTNTSNVSLSSLNINLTPEVVFPNRSIQLLESSPLGELGQDDDEALGKLSALLLYIVYLGSKYVRGSVISSVQSCSGGSGGASTGRYGATVERRGSSSGNSLSSESRRINRRHKHIRGESNEDEKGSEPPRRKKKLMRVEEINQRLACPYAKGDPTKYEKCVFVHRRDLPGIREHLKRNHFGGIVPATIRQARTWSQIFLVCNPNWPMSTLPIPSPHTMINPPNPIIPVDPMRVIAQRDPPNSPPPAVAGPLSLETGWAQTFGSPQTSFFVQAPVPHSRESEHIESFLLSDPTQSTANNPLNIDIHDLNEFFQDSIEWFITNANASSRNEPVQDVATDFYETPGTTSPVSTASGFGMQILTPRSSRESLNDDLGQGIEFDQWFRFPTNSNALASRITPPGTPPVPSQNCNHKIEKKYLLRIARKPALLKGTSSETSNSKKFYFDSVEEFEAKFENWMRVQFHDPGFCWGLWELENPGRQERLSDIHAVIEELEFMWLAYRSNEAALFLVEKHLDGIGWSRSNPFWP
ncbi:hypothetical protein TWF718_000084 [Orbilia javanica]|uniref:Uncharacterized protein n=1 Tax=Orbilia javanica TaxID=47235 RepID=A0AAN8N3Y5_9PEZI